MGLRSRFLYLNSQITYYGFNQSANPRIIVGNGGWLFCNYDPNVIKSLWNDYKENTLPDEVGRLSKNIEARGIDFYFVMPPTKTFAYPEHTYYGNFNGSYIYPTHYVTEKLKKCGVASLDLTDAVLKAKEQTSDPLWFKYDGHWNDEGSWVGYKRLYEWLTEYGVTTGSLPEVSFSPAPAYRTDLLSQIYGVKQTENMLLRTIENPKAKRIYDGDTWNRLQALKETYGWRDLGPNNAPVVYYRNPAVPKGKRVLLLMDSLFADLSSNVGNGSIAPLLAENVSELVAVWYAYSEEQICALIDIYQPQVVLYEKTIL